MDLNKAYYLKKEIEVIRKEIEEIEHLNIHSKQALLDNLNNKLERYCNELIEIDDYIDTIKDKDVRLIARLRYIDNKTWEEIGDMLFLDRTACYRKMKSYFKKRK